jgi:hypothetical protein
MNHIKIKEIIKIYVPHVLSIIIFSQTVKGVSGQKMFYEVSKSSSITRSTSDIRWNVI